MYTFEKKDHTYQREGRNASYCKPSRFGRIVSTNTQSSVIAVHVPITAISPSSCTPRMMIVYVCTRAVS